MKEYRLKSWPELPAAFRRTAHRRMLNGLSQRHMNEHELRQHSGLSMPEVRALLQHLQDDELLDCRQSPDVQRSALGKVCSPALLWLRRGLGLWRNRDVSGSRARG